MNEQQNYESMQINLSYKKDTNSIPFDHTAAAMGIGCHSSLPLLYYFDSSLLSQSLFTSRFLIMTFSIIFWR